MNPAEEIPLEHAHRAYYRQPVWKRIVVIAAGPAVNIVLAFVILAGVFMCQGTVEPPPVVGTIEAGTPAATALKQGDVLLAVDGKPLAGSYTEQLDQVQKAVGAHKDTPVHAHGPPRRREQVVSGKTFFDKENKRYRFGFAYDQEASVAAAGPLRPSGLAVEEMWTVTSATVSHIAQIFVPEKRKELGSVVGGYEQTRQAFQVSTSTALVILASSACRWASSTCSRSCRSTAGTSSGRWRRRSAAGRSPSA